MLKKTGYMLRLSFDCDSDAFPTQSSLPNHAIRCSDSENVVIGKCDGRMIGSHRCGKLAIVKMLDVQVNLLDLAVHRLAAVASAAVENTA